MGRRRPPGEVRDAIMAFLKSHGGNANIREIRVAVTERIGEVPASSIRSYLRLNTPAVFKRTGHGRYRLVGKE